MTALTAELDCGRFGDDRYTQACEDSFQVSTGVLVVIAVLFLVVGLLWWRHVARRWRDAGSSASSGQFTEAHQAARLRELEREYVERLETRDADALETSRDWADNEGTPWRIEVTMALAFLVLFGSIGFLIVLFAVIKALVDR